MALSPKTVDFIKYAVADAGVGAELVAAVNGAAASAAASHVVAAAIVATAVSQTTDFAALKVGDLVAVLPAVAGDTTFIGPIAVDGTLGKAAVVGNLYIALRVNS